MERVRETEQNATFPVSLGHICQEKSDIQIRKLVTAHAQYCFSAFFQRPYDVIKQAVAHFAPFLASLLLVLAILCFEDTKIW